VSTTRKTLLQRVRDPANREAWTEFFDLYAPLLEAYALAQGLSRADAEEVRDRSLEVVARRLPSFEYERSRGRFQGWLHAIARGKVVDLRREQRLRRGDDSGLASLADPEGGPDDAWDRAWRREHLLHGLRQVRASEPPAAFRVFELLLLEELSVPEVCARTGLNANQVYKAKARVLARVREHLARLGVDGPLT
jgi:RNA polymerase sigma-70 factor (ECF subfamily)